MSSPAAELPKTDLDMLYRVATMMEAIWIRSLIGPQSVRSDIEVVRDELRNWLDKRKSDRSET